MGNTDSRNTIILSDDLMKTIRESNETLSKLDFGANTIAKSKIRVRYLFYF